MKLFTKEIDTKLFEQYLTGSDLENQMVVAKIFNPYGRGTWYLLNSDPEDPEYLWAIVDMDDIEVGSVNRSDLENIKIKPFMLGLERDLSFRQMNALELYEGLNEGKKYVKGGSVDDKLTKGDKVTDGRGNIGIIKEVQANGSLYIQWISYSGEPTSDLTADNNPKDFEKMVLGGGVGDLKIDNGGNYKNAKGYELINQFDGTYQVLDPKGMDIVGEYVSLESGIEAIKDYIDENENLKNAGFDKMALGGGVGDDLRKRLNPNINEAINHFEHTSVIQQGSKLDLTLRKKYGNFPQDLYIDIDGDNSFTLKFDDRADAFIVYDLTKSKYAEGGGVGITESDIIEGVSFKNKSGTIFVIDKIELDPKFGKLVSSSLLGGKKGNYRDEITDFIAFLNKEKVVKYETGGGVEEKWQIKDSNDKYFSVSMQTGKPVWNGSPDLGYSYEKQDAEKIKNKLVELGNKNLKIVEYNPNWWKMETGGGVDSIKITKNEFQFRKDEPKRVYHSYEGTLGDYIFYAKTDNSFKGGYGSDGINKGSIYKLSIRKVLDNGMHNSIAEYSNKWDYRTKNAKDGAIRSKIIKYIDSISDEKKGTPKKYETGGGVESKLTGWKHKKK